MEGDDYSPEQQRFFNAEEAEDRRMSMMGQRMSISLMQDDRRLSLQPEPMMIEPRQLRSVETCEQEIQTEEEEQKPQLDVTEKKIQTDDPPQLITTFIQTDRTDSKQFSMQFGAALEDLHSTDIQTVDCTNVIEIKVISIEIVKEDAQPQKEESSEPLTLVKKPSKVMTKPKFGLQISTGEDQTDD